MSCVLFFALLLCLTATGNKGGGERRRSTASLTKTRLNKRCPNVPRNLPLFCCSLKTHSHSYINGDYVIERKRNVKAYPSKCQHKTTSMHLTKPATRASITALLVLLVLSTTFVSADDQKDCLKECDKIDKTKPEWDGCVFECIYG